jgi:hypothetical protein
MSKETFDPNSEEDMRKLKALAEKKLREKGVGDLDVSIDPASENSVEGAKELLDKAHEHRLEEIKMSKGIEGKSDGSVAEKKLELYKDYGDQRILDAKDGTELKAVMKSIIKEGLEKARPDYVPPAGSAPMNAQQMGEHTDLYRMKFTDAKTMVSTLSRLSREGNSEAESYLTALTERWLKAKKSQPNRPDDVFDPNAPENMPLMKKIDTFLVPQDPSEGELGKIVENWRQRNPRVRKARRGQVEEGGLN